MYVLTSKILRKDFPVESDVYVSGRDFSVCLYPEQAIQFKTKEQARSYSRFSRNPNHWDIKKIKKEIQWKNG